jgi:hypothetical protein
VRLFHKRLLILFSVALNIGFVIMAIVMLLHHPTSSHNRSYRAILDIVQQLNLPGDQERTVLETIQRFRVTMDRHDQDLKKARRNIVRFLSTNGPVDRDKLHRLTEAMQSEEKIKSMAFEAHFLDLRNLLGPEKGAQFFILLQAHHEAEDQTPH